MRKKMGKFILIGYITNVFIFVFIRFWKWKKMVNIFINARNIEMFN